MVKNYKIWFSISILIILVGVVLSFTRGFNIGIDFVGGTTISIDIGKDFNKNEVDEILLEYAPDASSKKVNETEIEIRSKDFNTDKVDKFFKELQKKYDLDQKALLSQNEIGESVGKELTSRGIIALIISAVFMLIYIIIRFQFTFGIAAIIALVHDVLVTLSMYAIFNIPINSAFIAAILTVVGYSINDTIVVFDRIRENKKIYSVKSNLEISEISLNQSLVRCINTSITTVIIILSVYIFVPSVRDFSFPILVGTISGTYSSIFIATPIWFLLNKDKKSKKV